MSSEQPQQSLFSCQKCRTKLFTTDMLMVHDPESSTGQKPFKKKAYATQAQFSECSSMFLNQPTRGWLYEMVQEVCQPMRISNGAEGEEEDDGNVFYQVTEGDIKCPKCQLKLGTFNWSGNQCSCGQWVTPCFKITKNRVDEFPVEPSAT